MPQDQGTIPADQGKREKNRSSALPSNASAHADIIPLVSRQLARYAGISKGLLYNYFTGKEDLLKHIFHNVLNDFMGYLDKDGNGVLEKQSCLTILTK